MAFNIEKINPLDLQPRKAVGVGLPFSSNSVFNSTYTTQDALKANLINYCLTEKTERFNNPDFGAGLRRLLFEPAIETSAGEIEAVLRSGLSEWFPEVVVNSIKVVVDPDRNVSTVYINYSVSMTNINDQIAINFEQ